MSSRPRALAVALAATLGCARDALVADEAGAAAPPSPQTPGTPASSCPWSGAPVLLDGSCTGTLAQRVFGRAVCACGALTLEANAATDGFDSRVAPWAAGGGGADVGAITGLTSGGVMGVNGNLSVSGAGVSAGTTLRVAGDLAAAGPLGETSSAVTVGGSARIGGDVGVSSLTVGGTLTTPPGAARSGAITAGRTVTGTVTVPAACPCGASDAVGVATLVARHQATNDDASIGLAPGALSAAVGVTQALPCGRFYLDQIQGGSVTLRATGSAALFVGGDLALASGLTIALDPGAELDVFVTGRVYLPQNARLGDPARPSALRLWLATAGLVMVPSGAQIAANVYAPAAQVAFNGPVELYGAVMAGSVVNTGALTVHYDRAIGAAASRCGG